MRWARAMILGAAAATFSLAAVAQESHIGTIMHLDEVKGKAAISQVQGTTGSRVGSAAQEYKVQDGSVFNGFKEGDKVSFTFQDKDGLKTITKLQKQ